MIVCGFDSCWKLSEGKDLNHCRKRCGSGQLNDPRIR